MKRESIKHMLFDALFICLISGLVYFILFIAF